MKETGNHDTLYLESGAECAADHVCAGDRDLFSAATCSGRSFAGPKVTPEVKERLRIHYGLDKPLPENSM